MIGEWVWVGVVDFDRVVVYEWWGRGVEEGV